MHTWAPLTLQASRKVAGAQETALSAHIVDAQVQVSRRQAAVTLIAADHAPDGVYERVAKQFTPEELANLTFAIATINSWNRLCIAFRIVPGSYKSKLKPLTASA